MSGPVVSGSDHDRDFGPPPRGRAGAQVGSRRLVSIFVGLLLIGVVAAVVALRSQSAPPRCSAGGSVACDFADQLGVSGYRQAGRIVGSHARTVTSYYLGPPATDPLVLVTGPGLVLRPETDGDPQAREQPLGAGSSTDPRYAGCSALVSLLRPPAQRGYVDPADSERVDSGELALLRLSVICP